MLKKFNFMLSNQNRCDFPCYLVVNLILLIQIDLKIDIDHSATMVKSN